MATSLFTSFRLYLSSIFDGGGAYGPGPATEVDTERILANGTGAYQADRIHQQKDSSIAASGNVSVDLQTVVGPDGVAIALAEVAILIIEAHKDNGAALRVTPSASNGWTAFLGKTGSTDTEHLDVAPGAKVVLYGPKDGSYAVTGTNKSLTLTNLDTTAAAKFSFTVAGRSV